MGQRSGRRTALLSAIFLLMAIRIAAAASIVVDGSLGYDEWEAGTGPLATNDTIPWSPDNDLWGLYVTWDSTDLYLGVRGYASENNVFLLYLDSDARTTGADPTDWYRGLRAVEAGWDPDILYTNIEAEAAFGASVRSIAPDGTTSEITGASHAATSPWITPSNGEWGWEIAIPWSDVGVDTSGVIRIGCALGWATAKLDPTQPLGGMSGEEIPPDRDGNRMVLDSPLRVEYDKDGDGRPDSSGIAFGPTPMDGGPSNARSRSGSISTSSSPTATTGSPIR